MNDNEEFAQFEVDTDYMALFMYIFGGLFCLFVVLKLTGIL